MIIITHNYRVLFQIYGLDSALCHCTAFEQGNLGGYKFLGPQPFTDHILKFGHFLGFRAHLDGAGGPIQLFCRQTENQCGHENKKEHSQNQPFAPEDHLDIIPKVDFFLQIVRYAFPEFSRRKPASRIFLINPYREIVIFFGHKSSLVFTGYGKVFHNFHFKMIQP